jgi:hypothetical protein
MPKLYRPLRCLLAGSFLAVLTSTNLNAADWAVRNPRLTGPPLNSIAASPSSAVAVGLQGHIVSSTDLSTWSAQNAGTNRHLYDVIYANNTFVAVGALHNDSGVHSLALTSSDGIAWTEQSSDSRAWKSVAHGNGTFVAVGDHTIDTSTDGAVWTRRVPFVYVQFQGVAFGNGLFVTTGVFSDGRGNYHYSIQHSTDGVTWTGSPAPANVTMRGIAFGAGQFVMIGDNGHIFSSPDGVEWTQSQNGSGALNDITFADGRFTAVGANGVALQSGDGLTWTQRDSGHSQNLLGVASVLGRLVAVGDGSAIASLANDGSSSSLVSATPHDLRGITFADGRFVAVGANGASIQSEDGAMWSSNPVVDSQHSWFNSVAHGNGSYVAAGGLGGAIFTSTDARNWTPRNWNLGLDNWHNVAYANGRFVAAGEASSGYAPYAAILTSTDSVTWTMVRPSTGPALRAVTYGNGLWVAAGTELFTSADATTWTRRALSVSGTVRAAAFGAGKFVLAGEFGGAVISSDGTTWTHHSAFAGSTIRGLAHGNNQFLAVGERNGAGVIWSSADGITWTEDGAAPVPLASVTFGNGTFTAVGANGFVLQSTSTTAARLAICKLPDGAVELACRTEIGRQYRLQSSTDGRTWEDVTNFRAATAQSTYRATAAGTTMQLYRLVSP